jgi:hypothetical protein
MLRCRYISSIGVGLGPRTGFLYLFEDNLSLWIIDYKPSKDFCWFALVIFVHASWNYGLTSSIKQMDIWHPLVAVEAVIGGCIL